MSAEQRIALRGHRQQNSSNGWGKNSDTERTMQRGNFLAIINVFSTLDAALIEHSEKDAKNAEMVSWKIQNDIIKCLSEFVWSKTKDEIQDCYAIITDEVTDRFSNKKILLFCLCYVRFTQMKNLIFAKHFLILYTSKVVQHVRLLKTVFCYWFKEME